MRARVARYTRGVFIAVALSAVLSQAAPQQVPVAVPSSSELAGRYLWQCDALREPVACAITHEGLVAVADASGEIIGISGADGSIRWRSNSAGDERLVAPAGIAAHPDGSLLVSDARRRKVDRFSSAGAWIARFAPNCAIGEPTAIAIGSLQGGATECTAIVDDARHEIALISSTGESLRRITRSDLLLKDGALAIPSTVAFVAPGRLAVGSTDQHAIFLLDLGDGLSPPRVEASWGGRGPFPGLFNQPVGVASDGKWLWIADQFNHRVARQSWTPPTSGEGKLAYGQHAVFPRAGEGAVHYPVAIAVGRNLVRGNGLACERPSLAVVCEPFERRVQAFEPRFDEEPLDLRLILPKLEGVQSHFGAAATIAGGRLFMHDPESATIVVFDLSRGAPIHVSTLSGAGAKPHETGRIDAMVALADGRRLLVADGANKRLALWELTERPKEIIFEPFMGRLVKTRPYARLDLPVDGSIASLAVASVDGAPMIYALSPEGPSIVSLDGSLRTASTALITAPDTTARAVSIACADDGRIGVLYDSPAVIAIYTWRGAQWVPDGTLALPSVGRGCTLSAGNEGAWWVVDRAHDCVQIVTTAGIVRTVGSSGVADGSFWLPSATARAADGAMYAVDSGNHRGQRFGVDGTWQLTFSLGRSYTRARTADEVLRVRTKRDAPAAQGGAR